MADGLKIKEEWDIYWAKNKNSLGSTYDFIASFYRKAIITNILNHFIKKYFKQNSSVLHAGCGGGQVDLEISNYIKITALDISPEALEMYQKVHHGKANTVEGNIFSLPFADNSFDSLYNLGVMEHFTEEEIQQILKEFFRVLKKDGKMIIFWPPVFGITVNFLDFTHFFLNKILRKNVQLHPPEITRIKSKKHAILQFEKAGFSILQYYFGLRDFFTQSVIVVEKK